MSLIPDYLRTFILNKRSITTLKRTRTPLLHRLCIASKYAERDPSAYVNTCMYTLAQTPLLASAVSSFQH